MGFTNFFQNYYASLRHNKFSKGRLLEIQEQRLRRILRYVVKNSEFYQELYSGIDIENCQLGDLPVVTKSAMMNNFDRLTTDSRLKLGEIRQWVADKNNYGKLYLGEFLPIPTSGTSGEFALAVYDRQALDIIRASLFARHPLDAKYAIYDHAKMLVSRLLGNKARMAVIAAPYGNFGLIIKTVPPFHHFFANLKILSLFDPIDQIVTELNEFQPHSIAASSFFLAILAHEQLAGNLKISFRQPMSSVAGAGEPLTEQTRSLAMKAWNIGIQDDYGAAECFFMAASCRKFGRLHAMIDLCILEVVDGDYNPVSQGEYGEKILVTNLFNFTQPIVRYEIEDIAGYAGQSCECGLAFPTLLPVQGRISDFIYFEKPNGEYERFHPYRFRIPLFYATEIRQYQIVQKARNELAFFYVTQSNAGGIEQKLKQTLEYALEQAGLQSRISLKLKRVQNISRDKRSGKFSFIKSLGPPIDLDSKLDKKTH